MLYYTAVEFFPRVFCSIFSLTLKTSCCRSSMTGAMNTRNVEQITNEATPTITYEALDSLRKACDVYNQIRQHEEELDSLSNLQSRPRPMTEALKRRLDGELTNLQTDTMDLRATLTEIGSNLRNSLLEKLQPSVYNKHFEDLPKSLESITHNQLQTFLAAKKESVEQIMHAVKHLTNSKVEKSVKMVVSNALNETYKILAEQIEQMEAASTRKLGSLNKLQDDIVNDLHKWPHENKLEDRVADAVYRKWIGLPSEEEEKRIAQSADLVREELEHCLQTQLLDVLMYGSINPRRRAPPMPRDKSRGIYTEHLAKIKKREVHQKKIRESLEKIAKMELEANDYLRLFDTISTRRNDRHCLQRLSYIKQITENHEAVLKFINAPLGKYDTERPLVPLPFQKQVPPQVNLYKEGVVSSALAASIVQYTKNSNPFAELEGRIQELEKKIEQ